MTKIPDTMLKVMAAQLQNTSWTKSHRQVSPEVEGPARQYCKSRIAARATVALKIYPLQAVSGRVPGRG